MTPVHLITGFLGAGKTTAILRFFDTKPAGENWAIIINEFGKISIDGQTLQSKSSEGSVFEISGGCICCSAQGYLDENLQKIIALNKFDRILIEPSGLGGIDLLTDLVRKYRDLHLMPVVCLVDLEMTRHPRLLMAPIFREQIEKADLILFSKLDQLTEEELKNHLLTFHANFPAIGCETFSLAEFDLLEAGIKLPVRGQQQTRKWHPEVQAGAEHWLSYCLKIPEIISLDPQTLKKILEEEKSILRAKGYIYTGEGWVLFNYTLTGISADSCAPRSSGELVIIYDSSEKENQTFQTRINWLISGI